MRLSDRAAVRIGYALSSVVILFMLFDGGIKLVPPAMVIETTAQLGYPATVSFVRGLGILGLSCTLLYAIPRTSALGAILLTGYLGGTVATTCASVVQSSATCSSACISGSCCGGDCICATGDCGPWSLIVATLHEVPTTTTLAPR